MFSRSYKLFFFIAVLIPLFISCSEDEDILLGSLFFGEEGKGIVLQSFEIPWDYAIYGSNSNSENEMINRGERIYIKMILKNTSEKRLENVSVRLRTENVYISNIEPDSFVSFGSIGSGATSTSTENWLTSGGAFYSYYSYSFDVSNSLPYGEDVVFMLDIYTGNDLHNIVQFTPEVY